MKRSEFATDKEWDAGLEALQKFNFEANDDLLDNLRDFFADKPFKVIEQNQLCEKLRL